MILQYAGLQSIPDELYEAAEVDGASTLQSFWYITIPQLRPILMINIILITISTPEHLRHDSAADRRRGRAGDGGTRSSTRTTSSSGNTAWPEVPCSP